MTKKLPKPTIPRLFIYLKLLKELTLNNRDIVTSKELSKLTGISSEQIRKDFSFLGRLGRRKFGYDVNYLKDYFEKMFSLSQQINIGIIGIGNLGRALLAYRGFSEKGLKIVAGFDIDLDKIGWEINGVKIYDIKNIKEVCKKKRIDIILLTTPQSAVSDVLNKLKKTDIKGILNFASKHVPDHHKFFVKNIDITLELEHMIHTMIKKKIFRR